MNTIIYFFIFIIGALFGSFFTLAVYRIPKKESVMYGRSYCPNCNHKLGFFDLIPILSYICLGGKCRYCKNKIRKRYLYLEILTGTVFLAFALSLHIDIYNIDVNKIAYLVFGMLYLSTLFIIGGIEKEKHYIPKSVVLFGLIIETVYIIYLYTNNMYIYKYIIYMTFILILSGIYIILLRKKRKENYTMQILILCWYIALFEKEETAILSIMLTILAIGIKEMIIKNSNNNSIIEKEKIPVGFYLCTFNSVFLILQNYIF